MRKSVWTATSLSLLVSMLLAACGGGGAASTPTTVAVPPTKAAVPTTAPAQSTTAPTKAAAPATAMQATPGMMEGTPGMMEGTPGMMGGTPGGAAMGGENVTITIWHQWAGEYLNAITDAFNQYSKLHPNVKIDLSKPDNVNDALKVAIPAGQGPDIIGWANDNIGAQALAGNIMPLDTMGIDQNYLTSNFEPAAVKGVVWQDKIWALPESQEGIALVYNKDLVTDKYLPTNPDDFTDLLNKATAFQKDTGKVLVCNEGLGNADAYHAAPVYFGFGVPSYVDDEGKAYLNTPEAQKAGDWLVQFSKVSPKESSHEICQSMLTEKKAGMWWTGPWAIKDIEKAGINYGILPMGKPFVGIKTLMLSKNAVDRHHEQVALDIMKYFTSADVQKTISAANKTIPASTAALKDPTIQALPTTAGFGASLSRGVPMANTPYASAQWGPVGDATTAIWSGSQKPADALSAAQKSIEDKIAQMK